MSVASCGGAQGGPGPDGGGQGLTLLSFSHEGIDNAPLNAVLRWNFSEAIRADTLTTAGVQIRSGSGFGLTAPGTFRSEGATVVWEPALPGRCDLSDAGLDAGTTYRVQVVGHPESFALRNTRGQPLLGSHIYEFHTRADSDPERFVDQVPGFAPVILSATPGDGDQAVAVGGANEIRLRVSENLDPCTVDTTTVRLHMVEIGDPNLASGVTAPNGRLSGFYSGTSTADASASLNTWGADVFTTVAPAQRVLADIRLSQDFAATDIVVTPTAGRFPENALLVLALTSGIEDFGGQPLTPFAMSFTTENLPAQSLAYVIEAEGETPFNDANSTAEVDTPRAQGLIQAYLLFAGDGDNGSELLEPSGPDASPACAVPLQGNDGNRDDFDPDADVTLDTGAALNTCPNTVDGSTAVVYEFATFRIRSGVTVRVMGRNPAIILVQGDVLIEPGGTLLVRGDGQGGTPQGRGRTGYAWAANSTAEVVGGLGVAGGGDGGDSTVFQADVAGKPGKSAYGSADGMGVVGGEGAGEGGTAHQTTYAAGTVGTSQGGGGGGHGIAGGDAENQLGQGHVNLGPTLGHGGLAYPPQDDMRMPSAGAGGGGGGNEEWGAPYLGTYSTGGGSGGAGGGFIDVTSAGNIRVLGTIDAAGSPGGSGGSTTYYAGPGGGGGGAGGGIRLLTSGEIVLSNSTVLTTAGGAGGVSPQGNLGGPPLNHGAPGGHGRIVLEDTDSIIEGLGGAQVVPSEGQDGFFRAVFDPTRFAGGGTMPFAETHWVAMGPLNPDYTTPITADFVAGIPAGASRGVGATSIFIEARGCDILPEGGPNTAAPSAWTTIGFFRDSAVEDQPTWTAGFNPADVSVPPDNGGGEMNDLDGYEYLQFRITFYLPSTVGPFDPGPFIDDWTVRFTANQ